MLYFSGYSVLWVGFGRVLLCPHLSLSQNVDLANTSKGLCLALHTGKGSRPMMYVRSVNLLARLSNFKVAR